MRLMSILMLSAALFSIGIYGVLVRRNAVLVLMSIELMLNAVNINLIGFGTWLRDTAFVNAQAFVLFVIAIAAAEVGIGIAIVLAIYRNKASIAVDEVDSMKW
ncbi:MAG: NADH-quinone oxidoreductase subunit NuoK [Acidobacteria bacterium]|nr:MAG: NADH-quinone oxidoreductase subunit NuoK [Acidobacteriota bacterium]